MASEAVMLSPLPRKALEALEPARSLPTSPVYAPSEDDLLELGAKRPFWYNVDDEATQDLREVFGCKTPTKKLPGWLPAFEARCLSAASTCATSPPPPSCISPPLSPDRVRSDLSDATSPPPPSSISPQPYGNESPTLGQQPQCPPGALDKSSWLQARKVFVGGIPQTIDQNALYHMFSKVGKVKKAWLQLFHADNAAAPGSKKHRGFGFVIFHEKHSINQLLGDEPQRFVYFGDDLKLEVKRAVGKGNAEVPDKQPSASRNKKVELTSSQATPASSQTWPSGSPVSSSISPQTLSFSSPAVPGTWQSCPSQAMLVGFCTYVNLPLVPPFPQQVPQVPLGNIQYRAGASCVEPSIAQVPLGSNQYPTIPTVSSSQSLQSQPPVVPQPQNQFLPNVLLGGFPGQKPLNSQELQVALLEALPDHYED